MAGTPEMQEQFPAMPWMAGTPEMQEQFPAMPWIAGTPEMQEQFPAMPWLGQKFQHGSLREPQNRSSMAGLLN